MQSPCNAGVGWDHSLSRAWNVCRICRSAALRGRWTGTTAGAPQVAFHFVRGRNHATAPHDCSLASSGSMHYSRRARDASALAFPLCEPFSTLRRGYRSACILGAAWAHAPAAAASGVHSPSMNSCDAGCAAMLLLAASAAGQNMSRDWCTAAAPPLLQRIVSSLRVPRGLIPSVSSPADRQDTHAAAAATLEAVQPAAHGNGTAAELSC